MQSRTPEGKHTKRYIVLEKNSDGKFVRSTLIPNFFETKEGAVAVVNTFPVPSEFKVRQK
jgi:hypothetical protein